MTLKRLSAVTVAGIGRMVGGRPTTPDEIGMVAPAAAAHATPPDSAPGNPSSATT